MNGWLIVPTMFLLRLGVPIAVLLVIGMWADRRTLKRTR